VNVIRIFDVNTPLKRPDTKCAVYQLCQTQDKKAKRGALFNQILTDLKTFFDQLAALKNKHYF